MTFFKQNKILIIVNIVALLILISLVLIVYNQYNNKLFVAKQVINLEDNFYKPEIKSENIAQPIIIDSKKAPALILLMVGPIGVNPKMMQAVMDLPKEVIVGVSPYSANLNDVIDQALKYNHEVLLNIPMQPVNYPNDDPGPYALLNDKTEEENKASLTFLTSQTKSITGIYSDMDEVYTSNEDNLTMLINNLKENNLNFIYGYGQENILASQTAKKLDYNIIISNILIDKEINRSKIDLNLAKLEQLAINNRITVAIARPYPPSIDAINTWIQTLHDKNIKLITIDQFKNLSLRKSDSK